ncbi:DUF1778 domain-containing protein [Idiomarina loihiensis]|nr:hypothetical protein [Idiomarina loihiensis]|tara:strand:+ start:421 stop:567 length:147 start_codon:yes stop_codon:yes gene_type:complete
MNKKTERTMPKTAKQTTKLNEEQWEKLNKLINDPPEPTEVLKRLMKNS